MNLQEVGGSCRIKKNHYNIIGAPKVGIVGAVLIIKIRDIAQINSQKFNQIYSAVLFVVNLDQRPWSL